MLLPRTIVPENQVWGGNPAGFIRNCSESEKIALRDILHAATSTAGAHSKEYA